MVKVTDYVGEFIYETESGGSRSLSLIQHEEGRVIPNESEGSYDYQYHLKDHLGNVRLTFSTTPEEYVIFEDYESTGDSDFQDLHDISLSNRNTTTPYASNDRVDALGSGVTSSMILLSMNKGDTIDLSVNASYTDAQAGNTFLSIGYNALFNSFDGAFGGVEGVQSTSTDFSDALSSSHMTGKDVESAPRGFLNYIFFDKEMKYVKAGFQQVSTAGHTSGPNTYEVLEINDIIAEQEGYILAYLSNENQEAINIYFDDFKVTHSKTNVVSTQDYYPFGLTFNESVRVASAEQRYGFNGKEKDDIIGWNDFGDRLYEPAIARFETIDPLAMIFQSYTPYQYALNNPIRFEDWQGQGPGDRVKMARTIASWNIPYSMETGVNSTFRQRTEITTMGAGLKHLDCSEFVYRVLESDGLVENTGGNTASLTTEFANSEKWVKSNSPEAGDVFLWRDEDEGKGHTGVVTGVKTDDNGNIIEVEITHAKGTDYGTVTEVKSLTYFTEHWGWKGFFRPVTEFRPEKIERKEDETLTEWLTRASNALARATATAEIKQKRREKKQKERERRKKEREEKKNQS
ncbi:RHS repeat-associated core domain-containing protein [Ekhidna sp.]